jgi:hypothetical protein
VNGGNRSHPKSHRHEITSDVRTLRRGRSNMDSGEHRRSTTKDLQTLQARCSQQRNDVKDAAIVVILQIKAFARRQLPMPSEGGRWLHASATPPRGEKTPTGALAAGQANPGQDFCPYRCTSPHLQGLEQQRPYSLTPAATAAPRHRNRTAMVHQHHAQQRETRYNIPWSVSIRGISTTNGTHYGTAQCPCLFL